MSTSEPKIIVGLSGHIGCGKTTITKHLTHYHGAVGYRFSSILRDILQRLHKPLTRRNNQDMFLALQHGFGEDVLAEAIAQDVQKDHAKFIVVEGIRRKADITHLQKLPHFYLIAVDVDAKTRYQRITDRRENTDDQTKTFEQFQKDAEYPTETQIDDVMSVAHFRLSNNGSLEQLHHDIDAIVTEIKQKLDAN